MNPSGYLRLFKSSIIILMEIILIILNEIFSDLYVLKILNTLVKSFLSFNWYWVILIDATQYVAQATACTRATPYNFYLANDVEWIGAWLHYADCIYIFSERKNEIKIKKSETQKSYFSLWQNDKKPWYVRTVSFILK